MVTRRTFLVQSAGLIAAPAIGFGATPQVVDVLGNQVPLAQPPQRIVLLDATDLYAVAALIPDASERIVGWASAARLDLGAEAWRLGDGFADVGGISPDTVSIEAILKLEPDLVISSAYMLPPQGSVLQQQLEAAGIPVAWSSEYNHAFGPQEKLQRAMSFWGALFQEEERARTLAAIGTRRFSQLSAAPKPQVLPRVYMEIMTTYDSCCWAAGQSFWGPLFSLVGGDLIAGSDGWGAQLSEEGLLTIDPEVYVATGGNFSAALQPQIAPGRDIKLGQQGLSKAADRRALRHTKAVLNGRVHGIWSGLISSPVLVPILADALASWLHPEVFPDVDPTKTLAKINRYFAQPLPGPMWMSLGDV